MKKSRKILLHFFIGIALPSLLLGYLALRGIQNDQALLEKEKIEEHLKIAELIRKLIDEDISQVEQIVLINITENKDLKPYALLSKLDSLKDQYPLIEELFLVEDSHRVKLPIANLIYAYEGKKERSPRTLFPSSILEEIKFGEYHEFERRDYEKALENYRRAYAQSLSKEIKGMLLNSIARVNKKLSRFDDAVKSYEIMAKDYSHTITAGGLPFGIAARLELCYLQVNSDSVRAIENFIELYRDMIDGEWSLEKPQYDFIVGNINESIDALLLKSPVKASLADYQNVLMKMRNEEKEKKEYTERMLMFLESFAAKLDGMTTKDLDNDTGNANRFVHEAGERVYLVSFFIENPSIGDNLRGNWGLLLDGEHIINHILKRNLEDYLPPPYSGWVIRKSDGEEILKSANFLDGSITVIRNFKGNLPPWSLELYQQEMHLLEALMSSRRGIYFYMFVLLAGILLFGLTLTIRTMTHELELAKMKSDFVSTVSHEFKSPLTSIRQLSEMLQGNRVSSEERRQRYYNILVEQSNRLSSLIDNILDFSKMEEGKKEFRFEKVDVRSLLHEIVNTVEGQLVHKDIKIELKIDDSEKYIKADRIALTQAITNLIDNAVKYSGDSKRVMVKEFTKDVSLVIEVEDYGVGIPSDEIDTVFDRFHRGGNELTRAVKGSGLGLTLVKQIVEAHHGTVKAESKIGKGSKFSLLLPIHNSKDE